MTLAGLRRILHLSLALLCAGCATRTTPDHFEAFPVAYDSLIGWPQDDHKQALSVFLSSCQIFANKPQAQTSGSHLRVPADVWRSLCADGTASQASEQTARAFFERRFIPFRVTNNYKDHGLFTGYYEPVLYGSRKQGHDFKYPIYGAPPELKTHKPYYSRAEIDKGVLNGRHLEILWVDDPVMLFFLHIQGSGRVKLPDGEELRIGYADQNGYPYAGLGKIMGDEKLIPSDKLNFFTIRQWLYDHRTEAFPMMERNPSYVFFKETRGQGPFGAAGAVLTPQRSVAVDKQYIPYGLPLYMETELPAELQRPPLPFGRLVVAQDTGGAIKGPVRADIFFGAGDQAEYYAGYMKGHGVYSLLVPKEISSQLP